jgi:hypothetical protein
MARKLVKVERKRRQGWFSRFIAWLKKGRKKPSEPRKIKIPTVKREVVKKKRIVKRKPKKIKIRNVKAPIRKKKRVKITPKKKIKKRVVKVKKRKIAKKVIRPKVAKPKSVPKPVKRVLEKVPQKVKPTIPRIRIKKIELKTRIKERKRLIKIKANLENKIRMNSEIKKEPQFKQQWKRLKRDILTTKKLTENEKEKLLSDMEKLKPEVVLEAKPKVLEIERPKQKRTVELPEEGKGIVIQTELDQIMDLLAQRKKIGLRKLSEQFQRDMPLIEEWAKTLHDEGLAELVYPFAGGPFLRLKEVKKVGEEKNDEKKTKKKNHKEENKEEN